MSEDEDTLNDIIPQWGSIGVIRICRVSELTAAQSNPERSKPPLLPSWMNGTSYRPDQAQQELVNTNYMRDQGAAEYLKSVGEYANELTAVERVKQRLLDAFDTALSNKGDTCK
jgi:hypothetical protein